MEVHELEDVQYNLAITSYQRHTYQSFEQT